MAKLTLNDLGTLSIQTSTSTVSGTMSYNAVDFSSFAFQNSIVNGGYPISIPLPFKRVSISSNTTIYLVAISQFVTSTMSASGSLQARRVR